MSTPHSARLRSALATAAVALVLGGCALSGTKPASGSPFGQGLPEQNQVQIHIRNFNFNDATVWVLVRDAQRTRLGIVTGKSDATFTLPWTFSEPVRLRFDLLADVHCVTEELSVDPGDILELQISVDPSQDPSCR